MNNRFDKILSNAFRSQMKQELDALPSDDKLREKFPVNKENRKKIKKLIHKERSLYFLYLQRTAAFILVFGIVTFGLMMTNTEIRADMAEIISSGEQSEISGSNEPVTYESFMERLISENKGEIDEVLKMLKENEYGWGGVPDLPEDIVAEDLVRLYKFEDSHIVNVYNEKGTLVDNFNDEYRYKYFCDETKCVAEIRKNEDGNWDIAISDMEIKYRQERFPGQPCNFKEMIADTIKQYPNLDTESVKYIEFDILGTYILYFISEGTEYLATYPLDDLQKEFEYGKIFTLAEFIDTIDEFSIFNRTTPLEGYGGPDIGTIKRVNTIPWYSYPIAGFIITVALFVIYDILKNKRQRA